MPSRNLRLCSLNLESSSVVCAAKLQLINCTRNFLFHRQFHPRWLIRQNISISCKDHWKASLHKYRFFDKFSGAVAYSDKLLVESLILSNSSSIWRSSMLRLAVSNSLCGICTFMAGLWLFFFFSFSSPLFFEASIFYLYNGCNITTLHISLEKAKVLQKRFWNMHFVSIKWSEMRKQQEKQKWKNKPCKSSPSSWDLMSV